MNDNSVNHESKESLMKYHKKKDTNISNTNNIIASHSTKLLKKSYSDKNMKPKPRPPLNKNIEMKEN